MFYRSNESTLVFASNASVVKLQPKIIGLTLTLTLALTLARTLTPNPNPNPNPDASTDAIWVRV